jgi:uncharacterized protein (UPF0335 family)
VRWARPHPSWRVQAAQSRLVSVRDRRQMNTNSVDAGHLRAFIERIEHLEEEKRAIADDIKEVYAEAKGTGYDVKIMRKIITLRRQDRDKRKEEEEILDLYLTALGEA